MNQKFLEKLLDSDISRSTKEEILRYWLLPQSQTEVFADTKAPIQKVEGDKPQVGSIKRPSKEDLDLRNNPKLKEEQEEMENILKGVVEDEIE